MTEQFDNPMGIDGFDFVEYAAPDAGLLHDLFPRLGFTAVGKHKSRDITLYRQGDISFLVNEQPSSFAAEFAQQHGPCACGFAIRVQDASATQAETVKKGATLVAESLGVLAVDTPAIMGIGNAVLYLVDEYETGATLFDREFDFYPNVERHPAGFGCTVVDHMTHNVYEGEMDTWAGYYERLFGFREIRYFDIKGAQTGLRSRAMTAPDGQVRIPINEATDDKSQIAEYLREYKGEGIQHVALFTNDIYATVAAMHEHGLQFLDTPDTYYEVIDERIPNHGEDVELMRKNSILIDGDHESESHLLLQIFTQTNIGPLFFEIIQRKGNEGFGEGNFQALFESIELDQMRRGVL